MTEIVAEISGNHGGSLDNAFKLIDAAAEAGADAVKFQCFQPERLARRRANNPDVLRLAGGVPLLDLYRKTYTPMFWFPQMAQRAKWNGIEWFSSVFDPNDVRFLEGLECPRYKISAFEMLDWDIIKAVRDTGKPIVISVRPIPGVTVMQVTDYNGEMVPLGLSAHGAILPAPDNPMVEWHLKLPGVETPDSDFSLTPEEMARLVRKIKK
jgi:sialic acid synthase SpsE